MQRPLKCAGQCISRLCRARNRRSIGPRSREGLPIDPKVVSCAPDEVVAAQAMSEEMNNTALLAAFQRLGKVAF